MYRFSVNKKTGFCTYESPVLIFEQKRNRPFYFHRGNDKGAFYFNLPKGNYYTENKIKPLSIPVPVALPQLPPPEKNKLLPKKVQVNFLENPNKASILVDKHKIYVDPKIMKLPIPAIFFVLFHEIGHYYYIDEKKCDLFAVREMLKRGFNPSQCGIAIDQALSNKSIDRKMCVIEKMKLL
jgi:hypothetical protein